MTRVALISDIHFGLLSRTAEFSVPGDPIKDETEGGESLKNSMEYQVITSPPYWNSSPFSSKVGIILMP